MASSTNLQTRMIRLMQEYLGHLNKLWVDRIWYLQVSSFIQTFVGRTIQQLTSSILFVECIEGCFLIQMLYVPLRKEALLVTFYCYIAMLVIALVAMLALVAVIPTLWSLGSC